MRTVRICNVINAAIGTQVRDYLCPRQQRFQVRAGVGGWVGGDRLRGTGRDDLAPAGAAFGPQVDHVVRGLDHIQIVFDDHDGVALVPQPVQHPQQLFDVRVVQSGRGLIEDVKRAPRGTLGQFSRQLHPLGLAAREGGGVLAQAHIRQAHIIECGQLAGDGRHVGQKPQRLLDGHFQHFMDVLAAVADFQGLAVVALALAHIAGHVHIRQEVHFHLEDAVALAGLAAAALDVEAEASGIVAARAAFRHGGEQLTQRREQPGVGRGVGAGRAADGTLIDVDHAIDMFQTFDLATGRRLARCAIQVGGGVIEQGVVDQRGLAGA